MSGPGRATLPAHLKCARWERRTSAAWERISDNYIRIQICPAGPNPSTRRPGRNCTARTAEGHQRRDAC